MLRMEEVRVAEFKGTGNALEEQTVGINGFQKVGTASR